MANVPSLKKLVRLPLKEANSMIKLYLIWCFAHLAQFEFELLRGAKVQTSVDLLTVSKLRPIY